MAKTPFISYSHKQGKWVWERLTPVLRAAGCVDLLIDRERFRAGRGVKGEMDRMQDAAEVSVLILSAEYLASDYCKHEMERAVGLDPDFSLGKTIPVVLDDHGASAIEGFGLQDPPLWVDFISDHDDGKWDLLLKSLDADCLRTGATHWLDVRDDFVRIFQDQRQSINLVVHGEPNWRALVNHFRDDRHPALAVVNLDDPATATLEGFVNCILRSFEIVCHVPVGAGAVAALNTLKDKPGTLSLALLHGDNVLARKDVYGHDIFFALRHLVSDERKLVLLVESRTPFSQLLPKAHPLSNLHLTTVELRG